MTSEFTKHYDPPSLNSKDSKRSDSRLEHGHRELVREDLTNASSGVKGLMENRFVYVKRYLVEAKLTLDDADSG